MRKHIYRKRGKIHVTAEIKYLYAIYCIVRRQCKTFIFATKLYLHKLLEEVSIVFLDENNTFTHGLKKCLSHYTYILTSMLHSCLL